MWLADAENDEAEDGEEIEGVPSDAVECDEGLKLAENDVYYGQYEVEDDGVDGCVSDTRFVPDNVQDEAEETRFGD